MATLLEQNNISLPKGVRKNDSGSKTDDHEIWRALKAIFSLSQSFFIDSRASNHMVPSKESFYSLDIIYGPRIHVGDDSQIPDVWKGIIQFEHGVFNNVLYVASLASKLLYIYQMAQTSSPKRVVFLPDHWDLRYIFWEVDS